MGVRVATLKLQSRERMLFVEQFFTAPYSTESGLDLFRVLIVPNVERPATATRPYQTKVVLGGRPSGSTGFPWSADPSLFYIHVCFLLGCLAWLVPLLPGWGELVACREDGSVRTGEPQVSSGKTVLCVVNFILLYFPLMSICVWSNVLDYTLASRIQHVIQYLHVTLETLSASSRPSCPKQIMVSIPTEPPLLEQSTRQRSHDSCCREGSSRQSSSRHRRKKSVDPHQPHASLTCPSTATQPQNATQTDSNSKSPVDTSESTSIAQMTRSTGTQAETPMSQSISESSPSAADPVVLVAPGCTRVRPVATDAVSPSDDHRVTSRHISKSCKDKGKHKPLITGVTKKKHKHSRMTADWIDDEQAPLSQFPGGMSFFRFFLCSFSNYPFLLTNLAHLFTSQWKRVCY
ncbi:unnamed protein product [Echinostoma caproni]|uniref:Frizzled domain-containing protein n=1 Tax=Echinostoma caproni TaxID=27848 RepID=A0A183AV89_9TREM|nr:unnamed protein product [Echinostoma caproni]